MLIKLENLEVDPGGTHCGGRAKIPPSHVTVDGLTAVCPDLEYFLDLRKTASGELECGVTLESQKNGAFFSVWFLQVLSPMLIHESIVVQLKYLLGCSSNKWPDLLTAALAVTLSPYTNLRISFEIGGDKEINFHLTIHEHTPLLFETGVELEEKALEGLLVDSFEFDPVNQ